MSRSALDHAVWLLFDPMTISKCVALGQGNPFMCSVICYNATPLLWFVLFIELSCMVWNKWFVNYVIVRLPLIYSGVDIWINVVILQWLCNGILLRNRGWFGVPRGHPIVFLSYQNICIVVRGHWTVTSACGPYNLGGSATFSVLSKAN